jgi:D-amino-acid dehydrogenase
MKSSPILFPADTHVAVIGAGIVGINCALALAKAGFAVTLIDREDPGEGCSFGNAGILAEWSFVPIFGPEVLRNVPKFLVDPLGPLTIRWAQLPHILPWLLRMLPQANAAHLKRAADAMHHLTMGCAQAYAELTAQAGAPELVRQEPVLQVYDSEKDFLKGEADFAVRAGYGVRYEALDANRVRDMEPALGERFRWGHALLGGGITTNPGRLVKILAEAFRKESGRLVRSDVRHITRSPNARTTGFDIETEEATISADRLVIAAGAFSHRLAKQLGDYFPLGTERGYHAVVAEPQVEVRHAIGWKSRAFYATPMEMGLRLAGTVELAGHDALPDYRRADVIARLAQTLLPGLNAEISTRWMGFRPTLPDSLPVIGPSPRTEGLFYAFGHQHVGLTCGPATGRIVARLLKGEPPNIELEPFGANRF